jgi:hypothetical protein
MFQAILHYEANPACLGNSALCSKPCMFRQFCTMNPTWRKCVKLGSTTTESGKKLHVPIVKTKEWKLWQKKTHITLTSIGRLPFTPLPRSHWLLQISRANSQWPNCMKKKLFLFVVKYVPHLKLEVNVEFPWKESMLEWAWASLSVLNPPQQTAVHLSCPGKGEGEL